METDAQGKITNDSSEERLPPAKVKIELVSKQHHATKAVKKLLREKSVKNLIYGMDLEWERSTYSKGRTEQPDILQIGRTDGYCTVFRLNLLTRVPVEVKQFLEDHEYIKVGVDIIDDALTLDYFFGVKTNSVIDLRYLALYLGMDPKGLGYVRDTDLGYSYEQFFPSTTDWTRRILTAKNKQYAAMDAINAVRIFDKINHQKIYETWPGQWQEWNEEEYHKATLRLWQDYIDKPFIAPTELDQA